MTPDLVLAIVNLVAKVGIPAAMSILDGIKNAKTIDDAIAALDVASKKTWDDYKAEAAVGVVTPVTPAKPSPVDLAGTGRSA